MNIHLKKIFLCCFALCSFFPASRAQTDKGTQDKWLQLYDFDAALFKQPPREFSPFARWWWPGNNVTQEELKREVDVFADNAFGGVEIQPLSLFVPTPDEETKAKVLSWDSPSYYEHLRTVMEEAAKRGLTVDMTNGSGWPTGGPYLSPEDGLIDLLSASTDVQGGKAIAIALPVISNNTGVPSKLEAVLATKMLIGQNNSKSRTIALDSSSTIIVTSFVRHDSLYWSAPSGDWKIIAFWTRPNSLTGSMAATEKQGPVLDLLDSLKVIKNYTYLFGPRTGLQSYYGRPMRAVFTDSYEFAVDRFYSPDFLSCFRQRRGYDITPWLPANMQKGYNYASFRNPNAPPDFTFGKQDWRLRYDYDMTVGELLRDHFIKASSHWTEQQGLLFRTQCYGLNMDMIANAGYASIPETESMLGQEVLLKVMAAGAHLYNRPVLSAESVVYSKRAYMTTPQIIRQSVDKLFAAGVNQIIYHGVPYHYITPGTMSPGWYPFCSGVANFSSNLGEGNIFWKYQKEINEYVSRTQYALRSGKPHADVLIYFPFMNVDGMPDNPEEILTQGFIDEKKSSSGNGSGIPALEKARWANKVYPVINQLEARGITWEWINDASLQEAELDGNRNIIIRGNNYQALILAEDSIIQLQTAIKINELAKKGMNFCVTGCIPAKQPSYLNWETNDQLTGKRISQALTYKNSRHLQNVDDVNQWTESLHLTVRFNGSYSFTRQQQRNMSDGSRIQFIWNKSDAWQTLSLTLDKIYNNVFWLDTESGAIHAIADRNNTTLTIPPYGTIILYADAGRTISPQLVSASEPVAYPSSKVLTIGNWDIRVDSVEMKNHELFDWKDNEKLKFVSHEGVYTASFQMEALNPHLAYFVDLGKVYYTAEVLVNGESAGRRIVSPYCLNITKYLKKGENTLEVRVTPAQFNEFTGEFLKGKKQYSAFRGKENSLMPAGLAGPVVISAKPVNKNESRK